MNGIKLRAEEIPPLKLERIKWISLLLLSHVLVLLASSPQIPKLETELPLVQEGFMRLQMPLESQVPDNAFASSVILMTSDRKLISKQAKLINKLPPKNGLNSIKDHFLVEIPESDLNKLVEYRSKKILAYPASAKLSFNNIIRRKNYEIHF